MEPVRPIVRALTALSFVAIGVAHFTHTALFEGIVPPAFSSPRLLVLVSGVAEILGGVGLMVPATRRFAGWGLLALLVAVFPANIHMALNEVYLPVDAIPQSRVGLWVRLPFQLVIAAQVWFAMGPHSQKR